MGRYQSNLLVGSVKILHGIRVNYYVGSHYTRSEFWSLWSINPRANEKSGSWLTGELKCRSYEIKSETGRIIIDLGALVHPTDLIFK